MSLQLNAKAMPAPGLCIQTSLEEDVGEVLAQRACNMRAVSVCTRSFGSLGVEAAKQSG